MAFADEIRVEIENYLKLYDTYKNTDFSEQLKILDKALKMEEERYRSDVLPLHTQIKAVEKALSGLKKLKVRQIKFPGSSTVDLMAAPSTMRQ